VAAAPVDTSPVTVVGLRSYDPNGDDSTENEAMVTALSDGNPATSWATLCYQNEYFGQQTWRWHRDATVASGNQDK